MLKRLGVVILHCIFLVEKGDIHAFSEVSTVSIFWTVITFTTARYLSRSDCRYGLQLSPSKFKPTLLQHDNAPRSSPQIGVQTCSIFDFERLGKREPAQSLGAWRDSLAPKTNLPFYSLLGIINYRSEIQKLVLCAALARRSC